MKLDFLTLFVIILLNSVGFALVWAIIAVWYRSVLAARYWFAALLMTCLSGPALLLGAESQVWNHVANLMVVFSFCLLWQGIRVFFDRPPLWPVVCLIVTASAVAMVLFGMSGPANNVIFATSQLVPIILAMYTLVTVKRRQAGIWVAAAAFGVFISGQGAETVTNSLRLAGLMSDEAYYRYAAWFLVCAIIGGSISNLGFLLMAVDRLRGELHALATRDELTGLPNRRAFGERLLLIEKRARRLQRTVSVLMMDLDEFKSINDSQGHPAGDAALKHIAAVVRQNLREVDFLARIGGDEFCILMPDSDQAFATAIANRITEAVANSPLHWRDEKIALAASIGLNHWDPSSGSRLVDSLSPADDALMRNKRGRAGIKGVRLDVVRRAFT
jgi:diguanylate cyclase (GGDEF)-like protein